MSARTTNLRSAFRRRAPQRALGTSDVDAPFRSAETVGGQDMQRVASLKNLPADLGLRVEVGETKVLLVRDSIDRGAGRADANPADARRGGAL
jgi:hypothetical protein